LRPYEREWMMGKRERAELLTEVAALLGYTRLNAAAIYTRPG
jgi:hypothetical protein